MTRPWPADLPPMHVLSLMSGTSVDGTDGVLARFEQVGGALTWEVLDRASLDFEPELRRRLLRAIEPGGADAVALTQLHAEVGETYADLCSDVASRHRVHLVGLSGQTIYHIPRLDADRGWRAISTLQVGEPSRVLERLRVPVVSDFFDFSIYIDAQEELIRAWYIDRFMRLRDTAFRSGAQFVTTDYYLPSPFGTGYVVELPSGTVARCSPVRSPDADACAALEEHPDN